MAAFNYPFRSEGVSYPLRPTVLTGILAAFILAIPPRVTARENPPLNGDLPVTQQEEIQELELVRRELSELEKGLEEAIAAIDSGREKIDDLKKELKRVEEDLEGLEDIPGFRMVERQLRNIKRRFIETTLWRALAPIPGGREEFDPEIWREMFPDIEEMARTSTRRDIFRIGEDVEIGTFEKVRGDVIVIGGEITVRGSVTGNVVAIGNDIHITSTGKIDGDAVTVGGHIRQDAGGTVHGSFVDTYGFWPTHFMWRGNRFAWFLFSLAGVVFLVTISVLVGLVLPKNVDRVELQARTSFGMSFLVGLITQIALPVVFILLLITIIGIPVALILVPLAVIGLLFLGFTGVAKAVGQGAEERGLRLGGSSLALIAVGVLTIELISIAGRAIGIVGDLFTPLAMAIRLAGGLVVYVAWTTGLGAALMTRFGTRTPGEKAASAPKPAPSPVGSETIT